MDSDVIYKFVFGFESSPISSAAFPVASVICIFLIISIRTRQKIEHSMFYLVRQHDPL